ncbi:hypothetical protein Q5752_005748 [Cryptotrichosporon argae]
MSTLATADLASDDSDTDFVPSTSRPKRRRASVSPASSPSGSGRDSELDAVPGSEVQALVSEQETAAAEASRNAALETFRKMQEGADEVPPSKDEVKKQRVKWVSVRVPRRFAGETVMETIKIREDDPRAIAAAANSSFGAGFGVSTHASASPPASPHASGPETASSSAVAGPVDSAGGADGEAAAAGGPSAIKKGVTKKAPLRKKMRASLEAMSAALDKGKKMTTLEKSQLDWKNHTAADTAMADELAANRRSGGALARHDFLERVGKRRQGAYDEAKR